MLIHSKDGPLTQLPSAPRRCVAHRIWGTEAQADQPFITHQPSAPVSMGYWGMCR